jgi:predicted CXXCH cytochrome family protein
VPVAKGNCTQCHPAPGSPNQFQTKLVGAALCKSCHAVKMTAMFDKDRLHRPVADGDCLACHNPHASKIKGLIKGNMIQVCGECHGETIKRQERSVTKHKPIGGGECVACHDPHASNAPLLFAKEDTIDTCGKCHDWQKHSSHPIGQGKVDPRNKNLQLDCLSCHRAHGTEYKHMFPYATHTDLCTKCHTQYTR